MLLQNKKAVIYGAGGAIGGAVASAFAREGARLFLTGRRLESLPRDLGAKLDVVDALDEKAVEAHLADIGGADISFNAIGLAQQGIQGLELTDLELGAFTAPIHTYLTSHFLTARAAARRMESGGVILTLTATPARGAVPFVGGMAPAWAGVEALTRVLAAELGPRGVRVICLRADGMPETATIDTVFGAHGKAHGITREQFTAAMTERTLLKRLPTLAELAEAAVYFASDRAGAFTGGVINVSAGSALDG